MSHFSNTHLSIHSLTKEELTKYCVDAGVPSFRAKQIWNWLYSQYVGDWASVENVSEKVRLCLSSVLSLDAAVIEKTDGPPGDTQKILVRLRDGEFIEEVLIPSMRGRRTVCVSSQVGCKFACSFCASGKNGFQRDLNSGEIVSQVVLAARIFEERPTNVVFMGIGEPFDNYDAVIKAARIMNDHDGLNIGARKITISTAGVIPGIEKFANEGKQFELSVSLHAATDSLRTQLMPINRKYPLKQLIQACHAYTEKTNRIITFEYALINGTNDTRSHAADLVHLLSPLHCRVNLIPLSAVDESDMQPSSSPMASIFAETLLKAGINNTLRNSRGASIKAACGQLKIVTSQ